MAIVRAKCGHPTLEFLYGKVGSEKYRFAGNHLLKNGKFLKTLPCAYCGEGTLGNLKYRTICMLKRLREAHREDMENGTFDLEDEQVYAL
jgi:hypothetical protein